MIDLSNKMFEVSVSIKRQAHKTWLESAYGNSSAKATGVLLIVNRVERQLSSVLDLMGRYSTTWRYFRKLDWRD